MSNRERWILYPLLFFALALAARDQLVFFRSSELRTHRLTCDELESFSIVGQRLRAREVVIVDDRDQRAMLLSHAPQGGGELRLFARDDLVTLVLATAGDAGLIEASSDAGYTVRITPTRAGAAITVEGPEGTLRLPLERPVEQPPRNGVEDSEKGAESEAGQDSPFESPAIPAAHDEIGAEEQPPSTE